VRKDAADTVEPTRVSEYREQGRGEYVVAVLWECCAVTGKLGVSDWSNGVIGNLVTTRDGDELVSSHSSGRES